MRNAYHRYVFINVITSAVLVQAGESRLCFKPLLSFWSADGVQRQRGLARLRAV